MKPFLTNQILHVGAPLAVITAFYGKSVNEFDIFLAFFPFLSYKGLTSALLSS